MKLIILRDCLFLHIAKQSFSMSVLYSVPTGQPVLRDYNRKLLLKCNLR